ncbi:MAG TPA: XRE family transcriptional regulator [bacterium]|nr:XRE family transcriptional regulator [bacterium]
MPARLRRQTGKTADGAPSLGERLRRLRQTRGLTIKDVARTARLTESFISQLERSRVNPSVASLQRIAEVLKAPLGRLFDEVSSPNGRVVRRAQRAKLTYPGLKATDYLLSPGLKGRLEVIWAEAAPGGGSGEEPYSHEGDEECVVVLRGQMEIWVNDERYALRPGDAITFSSRLPHRWKNVGRGKLQAIWAITPPSY